MVYVVYKKDLIFYYNAFYNTLTKLPVSVTARILFERITSFICRGQYKHEFLVELKTHGWPLAVDYSFSGCSLFDTFPIFIVSIFEENKTYSNCCFSYIHSSNLFYFYFLKSWMFWLVEYNLRHLTLRCDCWTKL